MPSDPTTHPSTNYGLLIILVVVFVSIGLCGRYYMRAYAQANPPEDVLPSCVGILDAASTPPSTPKPKRFHRRFWGSSPTAIVAIDDFDKTIHVEKEDLSTHVAAALTLKGKPSVGASRFVHSNRLVPLLKEWDNWSHDSSVDNNGSITNHSTAADACEVASLDLEKCWDSWSDDDWIVGWSVASTTDDDRDNTDDIELDSEAEEWWDAELKSSSSSAASTRTAIGTTKKSLPLPLPLPPPLLPFPSIKPVPVVAKASSPHIVRMPTIDSDDDYESVVSDNCSLASPNNSSHRGSFSEVGWSWSASSGGERDSLSEIV
jgi:hypothetical protein